MLVAVDNLQGYVHQLHLEGDVGLVTLADDPLVAVDVHDVVRRQVFHVDEREGGEAHEYKDVTHEGQIVILELMVTTAFSSSSVRNSLSLQFGLIWNCANGLRGILPL